jgi:WhiB family redox-sensing transcriptional regulator
MSAPSLNWRHRGVCTPADLGVFFGPDGESGAERQAREAKARRVCAPCPVRRECLSFAVTTPQKAGYWGGTGEVERARIRRNYLRHLKGYAP